MRPYLQMNRKIILRLVISSCLYLVSSPNGQVISTFSSVEHKTSSVVIDNSIDLPWVDQHFQLTSTDEVPMNFTDDTKKQAGEGRGHEERHQRRHKTVSLQSSPARE